MSRAPTSRSLASTIFTYSFPGRTRICTSTTRPSEVDDAAATYDTPSVVVVPLHAGSGMRIKIAEALAAGRPIVTTTKGMTGLPLEHEEHVMVADTAEHFAAALVDLLSNGDKATAMGQRGRAWAQVNLQHHARAERLTAFLEQLVAS